LATPGERDGGRVGRPAEDQRSSQEAVPDRPARKGLHKGCDDHDAETRDFSALKFARLKSFA